MHCLSRFSKKCPLKQWSSLGNDGYNNPCPQAPLQLDFTASPMKNKCPSPAFDSGLAFWPTLNSRKWGNWQYESSEPDSQEAWARCHNHETNPVFAFWIQKCLLWASSNHQTWKQDYIRLSSPSSAAGWLLPCERPQMRPREVLGANKTVHVLSFYVLRVVYYADIVDWCKFS